MAAIRVPVERRVIPESARLLLRETYGTLDDVLQAADKATNQGELRGAWGLYQVALQHWLRERWLEHCGRPGSTTVDVPQLLSKLTSAKVLDKWMRDALMLVYKGPRSLDWRHVDISACLVQTLIKQGGAASIPGRGMDPTPEEIAAACREIRESKPDVCAEEWEPPCYTVTLCAAEPRRRDEIFSF